MESAVITDVADYFTKGCGRCDRFATPACSVHRWTSGLATLRALCRDAGLAETVKWGHPCYLRGDRNVALIGAYQASYVLSFFQPALMTDPAGVLEPAGPNARRASLIRFGADRGAEDMAATIRAYLDEAIGYADAGVVAPRDPMPVELPHELVEALDADPALAEAFHALTPGRQRSYAILLSSAKTSATRIARIARARDRILAGKGANER